MHIKHKKINVEMPIHFLKQHTIPGTVCVWSAVSRTDYRTTGLGPKLIKKFRSTMLAVYYLFDLRFSNQVLFAALGHRILRLYYIWYTMDEGSVGSRKMRLSHSITATWATQARRHQCFISTSPTGNIIRI